LGAVEVEIALDAMNRKYDQSGHCKKSFNLFYIANIAGYVASKRTKNEQSMMGIRDTPSPFEELYFAAFFSTMRSC
jgi:hypothetical protein